MMDENLTILKGKVIFPDDYEDMECKTVLIALSETMSKKEFLRRYFNLLPDGCGLCFYKNQMEFGPIPEKLMDDILDKKGGEEMGGKEDEIKELNAREALREHCIEEHEITQYREVAAAARELSKPDHRRIMCPTCGKIVNERGICECR
jgi:hypothetical protein